ncbi:MAG: hypothetical protein ACOC3Z_02660 [Nanoarchaeota archaeon]
MIKKFNDFNIINEKVKLTDDEKEYLWSKLEYRKKKNALETENELFYLLKGDKKTFNEDDFNKILNSLEYIFRKKLKRFDKPIDNEHFMSISDKIPEDWIAVKYSSLKSKEKK